MLHRPRRHALVHAQENNEFWLVDLGSANGASLGEESLSGRDVNYVFRMEKLAPLIGSACLPMESAGAHEFFRF